MSDGLHHCFGVFTSGTRPSGSKFEDAVKKTQAALKFEEVSKTMHAKNLGVSDEEIAGEIREYRKAKRETLPTG